MNSSVSAVAFVPCVINRTICDTHGFTIGLPNSPTKCFGDFAVNSRGSARGSLESSTTTDTIRRGMFAGTDRAVLPFLRSKTGRGNGKVAHERHQMQTLLAVSRSKNVFDCRSWRACLAGDFAGTSWGFRPNACGVRCHSLLAKRRTRGSPG